MTLGFLDHLVLWALEWQAPRVEMEPAAPRACQELMEDLGLMELKGTRVNLESAAA